MACCAWSDAPVTALTPSSREATLHVMGGRPGDRQPGAEKVRAIVGLGFAGFAVASGHLVAQILGGLVLAVTLLLTAVSWVDGRRRRRAEREALKSANPLALRSTRVTSRDVTLTRRPR